MHALNLNLIGNYLDTSMFLIILLHRLECIRLFSPLTYIHIYTKIYRLSKIVAYNVRTKFELSRIYRLDTRKLIMIQLHRS